MFIIRENNKTIATWLHYKRSDHGKILGFDYAKKTIYGIVEASKPTYEPLAYFLRAKDVFTTTPFSDYYNVLICNRGWGVTALDNDTIIENLNDSLGDFLDSNYPDWQRAQDNNDFSEINLAIAQGTATAAQLAEKARISALIAWLQGNRALKAEKIEELGQGEIPNFEWNSKP